MDSKELKKFLAPFKDSDLEELVCECEDTKISFKRKEVPVQVEAKPAAAPAKSAVDAPVVKKILPIKSTMVGTFFHSEKQKSDHPPFVMKGNHVTVGQTVGIVEAMKVVKGIESKLKGKIVEVLVKNGQPVEYGQDLFLVDTDDVK